MDLNEKTKITIKGNDISIGIQCLICGESVPLDKRAEGLVYYGKPIHSKICDKCKAAVLKVRKEMENK